MPATNITAKRAVSTPPSPQAFRALDRAIAGRVVSPASPDWDEARLAWALSVDQQPAAVALPESVNDIVAVVVFANEHDLRVAPQGTGHNAHPLEGELESSILLKTSRMRGVEIDTERAVARVEAGAIWSDVTAPAAEHGYAVLAGSSPDVGVVGYTLGGGVSWMARRYGLAANNVRAVELVTADGRHLRVDHDHEPDLFWAVRGGGGSFGIVTAIEIDLLPIREVYAGALFFPFERAREVLSAWVEWSRGDLPDEIASSARVVNIPPFPEIPEALRGGSFAVIELIWCGEPAKGERVIAPLRDLGAQMDTIATMPVEALQHLHMDPEEPVPGKGDGLVLHDAPEAAIEAIVEAGSREAGSALLSIELRNLGGALAHDDPAHGALSSIDGSYLMFAVGIAPFPDVARVVSGQVTALKEALTPWEGGQMYLNFAERKIDPQRLYAQDYTYRRLQAVKAKYDPYDVVQSNHPIRASR